MEVSSRSDQDKYIDELKESYDKSKVDSEQRHFEIEKQLTSTKEKLETETKNASEFRAQLIELEKKFSETASHARDLQASQFENVKKYNDVELINRQLSGEKKELCSAVDKKTQEIERLTKEWQQMSHCVSEANRTKIKCQAKLDEIQSNAISAQHREERLRQENVNLQQQNEWFQAEIQEKTQQILSARKDQAITILELQAQFDKKSEELSYMQQFVEDMKQKAEDSNQQIETYIQRLRDARDNQVQIEEQYKIELQSQTKLADIYKISAEDKAKQVQELMTEVDKLHCLLKAAALDQAEMKQQKEAETEQWEATAKGHYEQISRMNKELENANELIEAMKKKGILPPTEENIEAFFPVASTASRLLKSGMTLTQIYSEYIQSSESLHLEQEENRRLNQYLDQILKEIEEKAPVLKKQREDYENSLESISRLTSQLDTAMMECEKVRLSHDEAQHVSRELTRENHRLQQTCTDLGRQVRMLLKELEETRGTVVSMSDDPEISSGSVSCSSRVISENLVTFKSIEELQDQNQSLLAAIRDLSDQTEKEESESSEAIIAELKSQLDKTIEEIEDLRSARQRQATMVESVVRQRDMYKLMLNTSTTSPVSMLSPQIQSPCAQETSNPLISATPTSTTKMTMDEEHKKVAEEKAKAREELKEEFSVYRRERTENEKILNEQLDKYRQESSDMRVLNAKLSSQLDFSTERYKVLQSNVDGYKKEISVLQDKAQKLSVINAKYEETIATYRIELMTCHENLSRTDAQCQNFQLERDMLKSTEQRLLQENESMYKNQRSHDQLTANIKSIQNNLEHSDFEMKAKFNQKIDALEKENSVLRIKLDGLADKHNKRVAALEKHLADTRNDLDKDRGVLHSNREQLRQAAAEIIQLKKQLNEAEAKVTFQPQRVQKAAPVMKEVEELRRQSGNMKKQTEEMKKQSEEIKYLKAQLSTANNEARGLKIQLDDALRKAEQHKSIAHSVEQNLEEQNKGCKELKLNMTKEFEEAKQAREKLESQMESLEQANEELVDENQILAAENKKLIEDAEKSSTGHQQHFDALQIDFDKIKGDLEESMRKQDVIKQDLEQQIILAKEAQEKYQWELVLHANDVSELTTVKKELENAKDNINKAQNETLAAQRIFENKQTDYSRMETRVKEIQNQNRLLHEELEQLSSQMRKFKQKSEKDEQEQKVLTQSVVEEGESLPSEQLLEVIRFLRKEKDIAETHLDGLQAENTRLKHQLEYDRKLLEDAKKSLSDTKQREQISMQTAVQHAELMKKVETLNLLQDSNRMLREEKDRSNVIIKELTNKMKELEEEITPLQESKKYLQGQYETLQAEKNALLAEVQRWKARTSQLVEQCNKADPEEFKRLLKECSLLKTQLATANEETHKLRAELSKANNQITQIQTEMSTTKQTLQKLSEEAVTLKTTNEAKEKEIKDMGEKLIQLRKIGRKYRMQAEEVQRALDSHMASNTQQQMEETYKAKLAEMDAKVRKTEEELASITEALAVAESEKNSAVKAMAAVESDKSNALTAVSVAELEKGNALKTVKDLEVNVAKLMEQLKTVNEELNKEKAGSIEEKESIIKTTQECIEAKGKLAKTIQVLSKSKAKVLGQMKEIERLSTDAKSSAEKLKSAEQKNCEYEAQAAALKSQYEARINNLQKELAAKHPQAQADTEGSEVEKFRKDNADIMQKLQQVQKQLQTHQKQVQSSVASAPAERPGTSTETVKTANIKPMTTPTTSCRPIQSAMVQPVRSSPADSRIRASVQPMAVSTVTTASTQATPTATVMPVSVQESDMTQQVAPLSQMSPQHMQQQQIRPTQQVQPVSHVEEIPEEEPEVLTEPEPSVVIPQPLPTTAVVHTQPTVQVISTSQTVVQVASTPPQTVAPLVMSQAATSVPAQTPAEVEDPAATPSHTPVLPSANSKRPRDEGESSDDQSLLVKRTKTQSPAITEVPTESSDEQETEVQPVEVREGQFEIALVEPAVQHTVETHHSKQQTATVAPTTANEEDTMDMALYIEADIELVQNAEVDSYEEQEVEEDEVSEGDEVDEENTIDPAMVEEAVGDAIVLTSDEEEYEYERQMEDYDDEEDDDDEMQEASDEEGEEEEDMDEAMQDEEEGDDHVIVVDEDDVEASPEDASMDPPAEESQATQSQPDHQPVSQVSVVTRNISQLSRVPSQTDRLMPVGRAQQLPPFTFGEGSGFEVGDDGIVPSTPTLLIPRRHDDFAQAVSSPQIQRRFVFGATGEGGIHNPEFGRLDTQGALGVDDIRMDLTQFDDASASGRSVPVTPVSQNPPIISITEPSPPPDEGSDVINQQECQSQGHVSPAISQPEEQEHATMSPQGESSQESTSQGDSHTEGDKRQEECISEPGPDKNQETQPEDDNKVDDRPGTSEGSQDRTDTSGPAQSKPQIQRIIWDKPSTSSPPAQQVGATPAVQMTHTSLSQSLPTGPQRKLRGQGQGRSFRMERPMQRAGVEAGQPQLHQQHSPIGPRMPGQQRGSRGIRGAKRGQFHQQQHHRQPPF